jgi:hypothetical protein
MLYVARIAFLPFGSFDDNSEGDLERRSSPRLAIGIAGAYNQRTDRQRSTTGTRYTLGGFNYLHGAADLVFKWAGVSLLAEVVLRKGHRESRAGMSDDGKAVTEYSRSAWGYLAQLGVMVSSQVELAGRWGHMSTLGKTDPKLEQLIAQSGHEATLGANWYINGHFFKLQADAGLRFGKWDNPREYVGRLQLDASF